MSQQQPGMGYTCPKSEIWLEHSSDHYPVPKNLTNPLREKSTKYVAPDFQWYGKSFYLQAGKFDPLAKLKEEVIPLVTDKSNRSLASPKSETLG